MGRRAARIDDNQNEIVDALRSAGCSVQSLAGVGEGCPDLLVGVGGVNGHNLVMEIKDPTKPLADRQLTPKQKHWHREWQGPAQLVETVEQALMIVEHYRKWRRK